MPRYLLSTLNIGSEKSRQKAMALVPASLPSCECRGTFLDLKTSKF